MQMILILPHLLFLYDLLSFTKSHNMKHSSAATRTAPTDTQRDITVMCSTSILQ